MLFLASLFDGLIRIWLLTATGVMDNILDLQNLQIQMTLSETFQPSQIGAVFDICEMSSIIIKNDVILKL